ncbi:galactose-3-O-sulfotransferase 3-like [Planococcus citri]|uniref:galactose-3-O-sulfotransferase 3-like n=1 Tax=Planococcus citri TaxID=170843 RepID=UPI0031F866C1
MYPSKWRIRAKIRIFISNRKKVLLLSSLLLAVLILLSFNLMTSLYDPIKFTSNTSCVAVNNANEPLVYTCCTPLNNNSLRTNVYFFKTHKTGSTTVENVILRFALENSLDVLNVIYHTYYLPFSDWSIYSHTKTPNNKYHIMAHHVRYNSIIKSYQYPDTSTVTILRHPVTHFTSMFRYFRMYDTSGMSLEQFLNAPKKPPILLGMGSNFVYSGYNQMGVDLGFDLTQSRNKSAIAEFIDKIDREFDFVMIMEYMEASMVLLANLMGWPLENVAYLKLNAQPPDPDEYKLTSRDEFTIMDLNEVDTMLYHHFRDKFRKCVRQFGEERMNGEIQRLRNINEQLKRRCVTDDEKIYSWDGWIQISDYVPKNRSDQSCVYATLLMYELQDIVVKTQSERLQRLKWR